jgi:hypothetical protein
VADRCGAGSGLDGRLSNFSLLAFFASTGGLSL